MRVRILRSTPGDTPEYQYLTSFLVEGTVAIDAGCLGLHSLSRGIGEVKHVFITHAHLDHVGTLPIFLENALESGNGPPRVYGPPAALDALRANLLNGQVWVDSTRQAEGDVPWVELHPLEPERPVAVNALQITAVPVNHPIPTFGYIVDDGSSAVAFGADSGPTERIWEIARATKRLRAVFLECSFPNSLDALAARTGHLTPHLWTTELRKLPPETLAIAVHIKPRHRERVIAELEALGHERTRIGMTDREYAW